MYGWALTAVQKSRSSMGRILKPEFLLLNKSLKLKIKILQSCIIPVLLYGCQTWALTAVQKSRSSMGRILEPEFLLLNRGE